MLLSLIACVAAKTVYFIRHGEDDPNGDGLSTLGVKRSQCIATSVFAGKNPQYPSPERIIVQGPGHSTRARDTGRPLAKALGVSLEDDCDRDDVQCVVDLISKDNVSPVLVIWQHKIMPDIVGEFVSDAPSYPKKRYDLVWTVDTESGDLRETKEDCNSFSRRR
ncbi:putative phosphoglycerate mutase family protein [Gorgonomyces haynaldii]|nr:putative phosphoglycerate mutase family protein [Gorgonomyces haynaldii]